jgi:hypothetical protein
MLTLKKAAVVSKNVQERAKSAFDILEEIQDKVRSMGVPDYPKPNELPPPLGSVDIGALTNRDLESYYTKYVAYAQYLAPKIAQAEAAHKINQSNLKHVKATLTNQLVKSGVPKSEHAAQIQENAEYIEQEIEDLKLFATKTILASYYKAYVNQAKALSRVIELRKMEHEQTMRGANIGAFKGPSGGGGGGTGFRRRP